MRICIFAEGSYPYVLGGVSSWIDTLARSCPEHEFIIYAISAESKNKGQYRYQLPQNIVEIKDVFLDEIELRGKEKGKRYKLEEKQYQAIKELMNGEQFSWNDIFKIFKEKSFKNIADFFMSKNVFDIIKNTYIEKYPYTPFTEFIWTIRSMYLCLFYLLMQNLPEADIYHSVSTGYAGVLASYGKYLFNKPYILSEHGIYTREREEEIIRADWVKGYYKDMWIKYFYNLSHCAYDNADVITSLFNNNKQLQIELGAKEEKICIIPNGVDIKRFYDLPTKEDKSIINIGAIIRVVPIKDIKTMLRSFSFVKKEIKEAVFYIMGPTEEDPEYYEECLQMAKYMNLEDVHFTGAINITEYIGKMDMLVLTSISEGQPIALMEGMAARKPHVSTNVGDCQDLLYGRDDGYGNAGFVEYVMDYNSIAKSIIKLCNDENLRLNMGQNGYDRISDLYRKEDFIMHYKNLYQKLGSE
ncbi:GT4 family glycosyltransferase PelF [Marinisporobacter balticus]|uniref:Glycosyltransferase involved in cell wall biosynthesis n=1 Tax=Marinisporobacter balticus TaxID=2018667 RepID=A0A4R2KH71_9FIRM|nr:GT4 family glycosyltransferase PelF [Marinisporobacter balticus]TCO69836.1 glycosyltransferase involved in cell wall biosynthesis [Marinisporobacter balticus]